MKKNTKIRYRIYNNYELDSLAEYLEKQAAEGWELVNKSGAFLGFQRCEPKQVKINVELVYADNKDAFWEEFEEYCKTAGWERIFRDGKIQIYQNADLHAEPINTDPETKLRTVHRRCMKMHVILYPVLLALLMYLWWDMGTPVDYYDYIYGTSWMFRILFPVLGLLALSDMAAYLHWYAKARKAVAAGMHPRYARSWGNRIRGGISLVLCSLPAWLVLMMDAYYERETKMMIWFGILITLAYAWMFVWAFMETRKNKDRHSHFGSFILLVLIGGMVSVFAETILITSDEPQNIVVDGKVVQVYDDTLELTMEDLGIKTTGYENRRANYDGSPLMQTQYGQDLSVNEKGYSLTYECYTTKKREAYESVLRDRFNSMSNWEEIGDPAFGADKVYENVEGSKWLLLYPEVAVELDTDIPLTDGQKAIIRQKLGS